MSGLVLIRRPVCQVCRGDREVVVCRPGERVGPVIPCPHCQDPQALLARVPQPAPMSGGAE
jgi:hypothetical protein